MRGKLLAWLRGIVILAALIVIAVVWSGVLPPDVPQVWRDGIPLLAIATILGAGLDMLVASLRAREHGR